ncbi:MAG: STAS domain-containing protein [bacterium]|nr:STAS domain-containing protein [bacterium]
MASVDIKLIDGLYLIQPMPTQDLSLDLSRDDLAGFIKRNTEQLPMLVDLARVRILQSSGVGLLFYLLVESQKVGMRVGFVNTSELVRKVLDIAGVDDIAKVYENVDQARQDLVERQ